MNSDGEMVKITFADRDETYYFVVDNLSIWIMLLP